MRNLLGTILILAVVFVGLFLAVTLLSAQVQQAIDGVMAVLP